MYKQLHSHLEGTLRMGTPRVPQVTPHISTLPKPFPYPGPSIAPSSLWPPGHHKEQISCLSETRLSKKNVSKGDFQKAVPFSSLFRLLQFLKGKQQSIQADCCIFKYQKNTQHKLTFHIRQLSFAAAAAVLQPGNKAQSRVTPASRARAGSCWDSPSSCRTPASSLAQDRSVEM